MSPAKLSYIRRDVARIAAAYGYSMRFPKPFDVNWIVPHAAFLYAKDNGKAMECMNAMYRARFGNGMNIEEEGTITAVAEECAMDTGECIRASRDNDYHKRVMNEMASISGGTVFGVPTFIYGNNRYWGNDRLEWLLRDIYREYGNKVPDLEKDPMSRPF